MIAKKAIVLVLAAGVILVGVLFYIHGFTEAPKTAAYKSPAISKSVNKDSTRIIVAIGKYIGEHRSMLFPIVLALKNPKNVKEEDVIAWVDNQPITKTELDFRLGLRNSAGDTGATVQEVFNFLVEEKTILNYAVQNGCTPSSKAVNSYLNEQRQLYNTDASYRASVDLLLKASGLRLDEYLEYYEWYNAYRLLAFNESYKYATRNVSDGEKKSYWEKFCLKLKKEAKVRMNATLQESEMNMDRTRLYRFHAQEAGWK